MSPRPRGRQIFRWNDASGRQRLSRPVLECLEERCLPSGGYGQVNLTSDVPGLARFTDPNLVNPWGVSFSPTGPFWFANNGSGMSDLLDGRGHAVRLLVTLPLTAQAGGTPTGTVFNGGPGFTISENGVSAPSRFLFAAEDGTISGWSGVVDLTGALVAVDNSSSGAVYKGLALVKDRTDHSFLYAADFGRGRIDVFDQNFKPVALPGSFQDPNLPDGFSPFNIQNINDLLFVSYAQKHAGQPDDIAGEGNGFIDTYDSGGKLLRRFASGGALNSPWGLAPAPAGFGPFGGALLVGNNGDGHINAYAPQSGAFLGSLADGNGSLITVPHLWALIFGNGHEGGASDTLFFTAGLDDEQHGLFGAIQAPQRRGADTAGSGSFDPHAPGEPGDYPLPPSNGPELQDADDESVFATAVLLPLTESSLALIPTLSIVQETKGRGDAPAPAPLVVAVSLQGPIGTALLVSKSSLVLYPAADCSPPTHTQNHFLALNAFLDLNAAQTLSENPAGEQLPETNGDAVGARRPPSPRGDVARLSAEQGSESHPPSGQAYKMVLQVSSFGGSESSSDHGAGNEGVETHGRRSWRHLLNGVLAVVGIPVILVYLQKLRSHRTVVLAKPELESQLRTG